MTDGLFCLIRKEFTAVPSVEEEPRSLLYRWVRSLDLLRYPLRDGTCDPSGGSPLYVYNGPGLDVHASRTRQLHSIYHGSSILASSFFIVFRELILSRFAPRAFALSPPTASPTSESFRMPVFHVEHTARMFDKKRRCVYKGRAQT